MINSPRSVLILFIISVPLISGVVWYLAQTFRERTQAHELISEIMEIQWRSSQIREELSDIQGLTLLAEVKKDPNIIRNLQQKSAFYKANIAALLAQPFVARLVHAADAVYLRNSSVLMKQYFTSAFSNDNLAKHNAFDGLSRLTENIRRITTDLNTASNVRQRITEQAKVLNNSQVTISVISVIAISLIGWGALSFVVAARYNKQVRQFSLLFSHMTVTRVNGLYLWANESLSSDEIPDERLLRLARERLEHLIDLTEWLVQMARPQTQQAAANLVPLHSIVPDRRNECNRVQLSLRGSEEAWKTQVEQAKYHLIIHELVSNALDALSDTKSPHIAIRAEIQRSWLLRSYLSVTVIDNGIGMEKAQVARALEPFFSTKCETKGHSGLGLYGCRSLVRAMKGRFRIVSKLGHGTSINFICPLPQR